MSPDNELAIRQTEVTLDVIKSMDGWRPSLVAEVLDLRMRELESFNKRSFIETGLICSTVQEKGLYTELCDKATGEVFTSMNEWLGNAAPMSRSSCFHAMKCIKELKDVSISDLSEMSRSNVSTMLFLSTEVRKNPEVIKAAKTESDKGFRKEVQRLHPDQHLEGFDRKVFNFEDSQKRVIEDVIEMVKFIYGVTSDEAAMEVACNFFADGICELRSEYICTNRECWQERGKL